MVDVDIKEDGMMEVARGYSSLPSITTPHTYTAAGESVSNGTTTPSESVSSTSKFPLHEAVWYNDLDTVREVLKAYPECDISKESKVIRKHPINLLDPQGNTALTLAVMLGHNECVKLLLDAGANGTLNNGDGWSAFDECVACSNRKALKMLYISHQRKSNAKLKRRKPRLHKALNETPDFFVELKWEFTSWIPLVTRFCPSDVVRIWKCGSRARVDITLLDFVNLRCKRGNVSFILDASPDENVDQLTIVNHDKFTRTTVNTSDVYVEEEADRDIDYILRCETVRADFHSSGVRFVPRTTWRGARREDTLQGYECAVHDVLDAEWNVLTRSEHFTDTMREEATRMKESQSLNAKNAKRQSELDSRGQTATAGAGNGGDSRRTSFVNLLPYTPNKEVTHDMYFNSGATQRLGRPHKETITRRSQKCAVWLSNDYPMTVDHVLPVLQILVPSNPHFARLVDFIQLKMPKMGFPVQAEIPVYHVLTGCARFENFRKISAEEVQKESIFDIPADYQKFVAKSFSDISAHNFES